MKLESLIELLGEEVESAEEEVFELFAQDLPSQNLGFIDSKASVLELSVGGRDLSVHQSPSILSSKRAAGTTGAVVWKITPLFAEWISSPENLLWKSEVLSQDASVLELGCGVSGIVGLVLGSRVNRYVLTDQVYVARLVEQNLAENDHGQHSHDNPRTHNAGKTKPAKRIGHGGHRKMTHRDDHASDSLSRIHFTPLDWETDQVTPALTGSPDVRSFDVVLATDCIYNEALVEPFVSTCADISRLKDGGDSDCGDRADRPNTSPDPCPCICVIAQQLRDSSVFETWLNCALRRFRVWRVPDDLLVAGMHSSSGFVVHTCILRGTT